MRFSSTSAILATALFALAPKLRAAEPVDFVRDVVPAMTKAGCNAGSCHGAFPGRGGFALSLLGFDPLRDYDTIFKAARGRRIDAAAPENSLLLRKPTAAVAHGGGRKLTSDSPAYRLLRDFIAQGFPAPKPELQIVGLDVTPRDLVLKPGASATLKVTARWSDGVTRDVTEWALFDPRDATAEEVTRAGIVTATRPGKSAVGIRYMGHVASVALTKPFGKVEQFPAFPIHNYIDELVLAEWKRLGVVPAALSSDNEFLRRVSLDLTGTLPTPDEVRRFVADSNSDKRAKKIDELLERPEYADYWSLKWGDLLRVHRRYVGDKGLGSFRGWVQRNVRENAPLDGMVKELLTAQGNLFNNGPVAYFFVDPKPEELAETTAQLFLGVRLQCARCHHHPFEMWSQDDYHGLAAFFTRLEIRDNGDKGRFGGMQTLRAVPEETRKLTVNAKPRVLGGSVATAGDDIRVALADWLIAKENPFFARNLANRYWAYLTGRGIVEPVDDMRATNPPSNPALLDALAKDLSDRGYDAKHLIRTICNSRVYQLASELTPTRDKDGSLFTHRVPRRMQAEVLLDAINHACAYEEPFTGTPPGTRAIALPDPSVQSKFLTIFGRSLRNNPCECARDSSPDLLQALHLVNSASLNTRISHEKGRVAKLAGSKIADEVAVEELYLATLGRKPKDSEVASVRELLRDAPSRREGLEDVLWALLNSAEFAFNH